jgi:hypothetical protein
MLISTVFPRLSLMFALKNLLKDTCTITESQTKMKMRLFFFFFLLKEKEKKERRGRPETWVVVDDLVLDEQRASVKV